jgi:hypothetical protein
LTNLWRSHKKFYKKKVVFLETKIKIKEKWSK